MTHPRLPRPLTPLTLLTLAAAATLATTGTAAADEHYNGDNTVIGSRSGLLVTGQIDDPFEDVLEHAAFFDSYTITND